MDHAALERRTLMGVAGLAGVAALAGLASAGPLDPPPGPIAPTAGPEPRTPINQANCPGDGTAVFVISAPGSYYLTGNVDGVEGQHGILVTAANVSIDLNGFTLRGTAGALSGVSSNSAATRVANGVADGWTTGMDVQALGALVERVAVLNNSSAGIRTANPARVADCFAALNGIGIDASNGTAVLRCNITRSTTYGVQAQQGCLIEGCTVRGGIANSTGISAVRTNVVDCAVFASTLGIEVVLGSASNCLTNACQTGFRVQSSRAVHCRASGTNGTTGFLIESTGSHVEGCSAFDNNIGFSMPASGNCVIRNAVNTSYVSAYSIGSGGQGGIGTILDVRLAALNSSNSFANLIV